MSASYPETCRYVDAEGILPGWGCCACRAYNGLQRRACKACDHTRCRPLAPDKRTGRVFEDQFEAMLSWPPK